MSDLSHTSDKILFISELNDETTMLTSWLLKREGFNFDYVTGISDGLEQAFQNKPNLLIVEEDVDFPGWSKFTKQLSLNNELQNMRILLIIPPLKQYKGDLPQIVATSPLPDECLRRPLDVDKFIRLCKRLSPD